MAPKARGRSQSPPYQSLSPPQLSDQSNTTESGTDTTRKGKRWSSEEEQELLTVTARFLGAGKSKDWLRVKAELQGPAKTRSLTAIKGKYKQLVPQPNGRKKKELPRVVSDLSVESIESSSQDGESQETVSTAGSPPLASPSLPLELGPGPAPLLSPPIAFSASHLDSHPVASTVTDQTRPPTPINWTIYEDAALLSTLYAPCQSVKSWEDVTSVTNRTYRIVEGAEFDKTVAQCAERYYLALRELRFDGTRQDFAHETIQAILYTNFHREQIARYAQNALSMSTTLTTQLPPAFVPHSRTSTPVLPAPQINPPSYIASRPLLNHETASRSHSNIDKSLSEALTDDSLLRRQSLSASSIPRIIPHQTQLQLQPSALAYNEHAPNYRLPTQSLASNTTLPTSQLPARLPETSSQIQQKPVSLPFSLISPEVYRATWTNRGPSPSSSENFNDHSATDTPETVITRPSPQSWTSRDASGSPEYVEQSGERVTRRGRKRGSNAVDYREETELSDDDEEYRDVLYTKKMKVE